MRGLAFRPGTSELAVADGSSIALVDSLQGKEIFRFDAGYRVGNDLLAWQPDGRHLLSGSHSGPLRVWELSEPPPLSSFQPTEKFTWFSFSPDGKWLAITEAKSQKDSLINLQTGKVEREFVADTKNPDLPRSGPLLFRPDCKQVGALEGSSRDQVARVWDFETGEEISRLDQKDGLFNALAFGPEGHLLVAQRDKDKPSVWDVQARRPVWQSSANADLLCFLSPNGQFMVSIQKNNFSRTNQATLWELPEGRKLGPIAVPGTPGEIAFSPNGSLLAMNYSIVDLGKGKMGGPGQGVWSVPSGEQLLDRRNQELSRTAFSPDSRLLAAATPNGVLKLWDVAGDTELLSFPFPGTQLVFTPDGSSLATIIPSPNPVVSPSAIQFLDLGGLRRRLAAMGLDW